jgi:hypothetical protein
MKRRTNRKKRVETAMKKRDNISIDDMERGNSFDFIRR